MFLNSHFFLLCVCVFVPIRSLMQEQLMKKFPSELEILCKRKCLLNGSKIVLSSSVAAFAVHFNDKGSLVFLYMKNRGPQKYSKQSFNYIRPVNNPGIPKLEETNY